MARHHVKRGTPARPGRRSGAPCGGARGGPSLAAPRGGLCARRSRPTPRTARRAVLLVLSLSLLAAAGCRDPNAVEKARQRCADAGRREGQIAGDADGFKSAHESSRDAAYDAKIEGLYASDNFARRRAYTLVVLGVAFLSGFGLQYAALYLLRKKELLVDIDRIVLSKQKTRVDLTRLLASGGSEDAPALKPPDASPRPDS